MTFKVTGALQSLLVIQTSSVVTDAYQKFEGTLRR